MESFLNGICSKLCRLETNHFKVLRHRTIDKIFLFVNIIAKPFSIYVYHDDTDTSSIKGIHDMSSLLHIYRK